MSHRAYIGLGSNIEPERYLPAGVTELQTLGTVAAVSCVYESAAVGDSTQPNFLNAAVLLVTDLPADRLYGELRDIEARLGRIREPQRPCAARTIDLDLVLFDDTILTVGHRKIPDPDIMTRPFLTIPLAEIDAEYIHPESGETLAVIAGRLRDLGETLRPRPDVTLPVPRNPP